MSLRLQHIIKQLARRIFAAGAMLMVLFAQSATLVHSLTVTHVRCAEHGELIHVEGDSAHGHTDIANTKSAHFMADSRAFGHEHDHCAFSFLGHTPFRTHAAPSVSAAFSLHAPILVVAARHVAHIPTRVLDYAPKASPPAA